MKYTKRSTGKKAKIKQVPYKKVQSQRFAMCTATVRAFSHHVRLVDIHDPQKYRPLLFCERRSDRFFSVIDSCQNLCFINLFVLFFSNDTEFKNFVSLHTFLHTNQIRSPGYANRHTCCNYSKIILFDISFFLRLIHCMKK